MFLLYYYYYYYYYCYAFLNLHMWDPQVQFAQRRKFTEVVQQPLYMAKCTVLANYYLGFNGWSTRIMQVKIFGIPTI